MNIISSVISTLVQSTQRLIKIYGLGNTVRTPKQLAPVGIDSNPVKDMEAVYAATSNSDSPGVILGYFNKNVLSAPGELRIFSTDADGNFKANVWCLGDGTILVGASSTPVEFLNFFVKWNEMQVKMSELQTAFNSHFHETGTGPSAPPDPEFFIDMDISAAKTDNIKTI